MTPKIQSTLQNCELYFTKDICKPKTIAITKIAKTFAALLLGTISKFYCAFIVIAFWVTLSAVYKVFIVSAQLYF